MGSRRESLFLVCVGFLVLGPVHARAQVPLGDQGNYSLQDFGISASTTPAPTANGAADGNASSNSNTAEGELGLASSRLPITPHADSVRASIAEVEAHIKGSRSTQTGALAGASGVTRGVQAGDSAGASDPANLTDAALGQTSARQEAAAKGLVDVSEKLDRAEAQDKAAASAKGGAPEVAKVEQSYAKAREHLESANKKLAVDRAETKGLWATHKKTILTVGALAAVGGGAFLLMNKDDDDDDKGGEAAVVAAPGSGQVDPGFDRDLVVSSGPAARVTDATVPADIEASPGTSFGFQSGMRMPGSSR